MEDKYEHFIEILEDYRAKEYVDILHRGFGKSYAFKKLNLDVSYNSIEQFGERLFFFGEKSKYFEIKKHDLKFELNDFSQKTFEKIFDIYIDLDIIPPSFYKDNENIFNYFAPKNKDEFLHNIELLDNKCKLYVRNYYFTILHQLDDNDFKEESLFVSTSKNHSTANSFSLKTGIIINFWNWKSEEKKCNVDNLPYFKNVPHPNEDENSIFGAIFPHYIYSFEYNGELFINPALFEEQDFEITLYTGFDIDQTDFEVKLKNMTSYKSYFKKEGNNISDNTP